MAPVCVASSLSLCALSVFTFTLNVNSLLVYDRQTLLDLRPLSVNLLKPRYIPGQRVCPPLLSGIPPYLLRGAVAPLRRTRRRRRGKRSGRLVRLRACFAASSTASALLGLIDPLLRRFVPWHSWDPIDSCLVPVAGSDEGGSPCPPCFRLSQRGVNLHNLRPLDCAPTTASLPAAPARIGLVNVCSVVHKTFILKDFFMSNKLDFLFITETWLYVGESGTLRELSPSDCSFLDSPRNSRRRGGGLATVYRNKFACK